MTVQRVQKDPDGSYDVMGTKDGNPVMLEVSKDLKTIQARTGGPGGRGSQPVPPRPVPPRPPHERHEPTGSRPAGCLPGGAAHGQVSGRGVVEFLDGPCGNSNRKLSTQDDPANGGAADSGEGAEKTDSMGQSTRPRRSPAGRSVPSRGGEARPGGALGHTKGAYRRVVAQPTVGRARQQQQPPHRKDLS